MPSIIGFQNCRSSIPAFQRMSPAVSWVHQAVRAGQVSYLGRESWSNCLTAGKANLITPVRILQYSPLSRHDSLRRENRSCIQQLYEQLKINELCPKQRYYRHHKCCSYAFFYNFHSSSSSLMNSPFICSLSLSFPAGMSPLSSHSCFSPDTPWYLFFALFLLLPMSFGPQAKTS